jgi:hypothetical protein
MIRVNDPALYDASLAILKRFTRGSYYGRLVQIFLACKYYGRRIPQLGDSQGIDVSAFQQLLDELYEKPSRRPGQSVMSLFNNNHLYPTGVAASGKGAGNIWRNNLNIQKGFGCYASPAELANPAFRLATRKLCPHLVTTVPNQLRGAQCEFDPKARYRGDDHPKVFRINPETREHFVYDPPDTANYAPLVLAPSGKRLPIAPVIIGLYYDSIVAAGRSQIDVGDFLIDFDFSPAEALTYFDDDPALAEHAALAQASAGGLSWSRLPPPPQGTPAPPVPLPGISPAPARTRRRTVPLIPVLAPPTPPPAGGHWWDAEQAVRKVLEDDGWTVLDVSRFGVGYDMRAHKAGTTRHVEVKSSVGRCSPLLTPNELSEARRLRRDYVLAVVENFDPTQPVSVLWVQDPARLSMGTRATMTYSLSRSVWLLSASSTVP